MYHFSQASENRLLTCHPKLAAVARAAIQAVDFGITCGFRDELEQMKAYPKYTRVTWPNSKHNHQRRLTAAEVAGGIPRGSRQDTAGVWRTPESLAFDFLPYDNAKRTYVDWNDAETWAYVAGHILMAGHMLGITLRWGHDWNQNDSLSDETGLVDRPHIELVETGVVA